MKRFIASTLTLLLMLTGVSNSAFAFDEEPQQGTIEIRGLVKDEQNAFIVAAPVVLTDAQGQKVKETVSDDKGAYRFTGLKPGVYTLTVEVEGFGKFEQQLTLATQRVLEFDVPLKVTLATEEVNVKDSSRISTDPDANLTATVIGEKELEALPDDPDEMLDMLKQMAGAGGGQDAQVYLNGFREGGRIPPKEAILSIRLNSNPFSAEFSEPGFSRIEIITKPGASKIRGGFNFNFNDESLNARNAKATFRAPTQLRRYGGNVSGPIIANRWGYFIDVNRDENDDNAFINAVVLSPDTLTPTQYVDTLLTPRRNFNFSVRSDYLLNNRNTIGVQYRMGRSDSETHGGGFNLPERAATSTSRDHTFRLSLTTIASERAVNEFRAQFNRRTSGAQALSSDTAINVADAFNSGGNQGQLFSDNTNEGLELVNNLTYTHSKHTFKFGFRADATRLATLNQANFGGTFSFGSDFERDALGNPILVDGVQVPISGLELYRRVLLGTLGYRPSQFTISQGDPALGLNQWEMGYFAQDDWRITPKLTISYGVRHDFQTNLNDKINIAPRVGVAWNPDKGGMSTIRAGAGLFYNYLGTNVTLDTLRYDGERQQNLVIARPVFFETIPDELIGATTSRQAIRTKAEGLNSPYNMIATLSYERRLPWQMFGAVSYTYNKGLHLLRLRNINAPTDPSNPNLSKPDPTQGAIYEYESTGISVRNQVTFSLNKTFNRTFSLFSHVTVSKTNSDVDGVGQPSNPYDLSLDYGRSSSDIRNSFFVGSSFTLPYNFRINPYISYSSSRPFNITTGRDNNQDTQFQDRPAFAEIGDPGAIVTPYGVFNPNPGPGDIIIPRNFGDGPSQFSVNMSVSKTFGFGGPANNFPGMSANAQTGGNNQQGGQGNRENNQQANRGGRQGGGNDQRGGGNPGMIMRGGMGGGPRGGGGGGGMGGGGPMMMGGGDIRSKYNLTLSISANNLLNHTNFSFYNGTLTSPLFGVANQANPARRIDASLRFNF